jgi:glycosyltransferase involved in cell wall biosynthesis
LLEESGAKFRAGEEIITFVNRNLEPYRGYHIFMRALPSILKARPKARVLIVGGDQVSYGGKAPEGKTWKDIFFNEVKDQLDTSRVFFLGRVPNPVFIKLLQVSACHVYLTYPFVLSWSCIESLAAGCAVVASGTEPVREVIRDQDNGLLVDFFDVQGLASTVIEVLAQPARFQAMRERARADAVARFDLASVCLPAQLRWLSSQIKGL